MSFMETIFIVFFLLIMTTTVRGWGGDGHRIIADVSLDLMNAHSRNWLLRNLDEDAHSASVWADSEAASSKYPESDYYHFSHTPYRQCAPFDFNRDCGAGNMKGLCIVSGLTDAIERAVNIEASQEDRTDALKFIIHFMADIHQPLHTGFRADNGGVRIKLSFPSPNRDLHYIWDTWLIEGWRSELKASSWQQLAERLKTKVTPEFVARLRTNMTRILESRESIMGYVSSIATDTATTATCEYGYRNERGQYIGVGDVIGREFLMARIPQLTVQLIKAGVRLGILIDGINEKYYRGKLDKKEASRAVRLARLFSDLSESAKRKGSGSSAVNYFSSLIGEMNLEELEWKGEEERRGVRSTRAPPTKRGGVSNRKADKFIKRFDKDEDSDTKFLDDAAAAGVADLASYTFEGVNMSQLILIRRRGFWIITSKKLGGRDPRYYPKSVHFAEVDLDEGKREYFGFDDSVFPYRSLDKDEIIIRALLQIRGVDPRIDLTDFKGIKPVRHESQSNWAIKKLYEQFRNRTIAEMREQVDLFEKSRPKYRSLEDMFSKEIDAEYDNIFVVPVSSSVLVMIHKETMQQFDDSKLLFVRFNRFDLYTTKIPGGTKEFIIPPFTEILVDPRVFDGPCLGPRFLRVIERTIRERIAIGLTHIRNPLINQITRVIGVIHDGKDVKTLSDISALHAFYVPTDHGYVDSVMWVSSRSLDWIVEACGSDSEWARELEETFTPTIPASVKLVMLLALILILSIYIRVRSTLI